MNDITLTIPAAQVHKAVRNILVNEHGLNAERLDEVLERVLARSVDKFLEKHVLENGRLSRLVADTIATWAQDGMRPARYGARPEAFDQYVQRIVREEIQALVLAHYDITVNRKEDENAGADGK